MESTSSAVDSSREIEIQTEKEKMKKKKRYVVCIHLDNEETATPSCRKMPQSILKLWIYRFTSCFHGVSSIIVKSSTLTVKVRPATFERKKKKRKDIWVSLPLSCHRHAGGFTLRRKFGWSAEPSFLAGLEINDVPYWIQIGCRSGASAPARAGPSLLLLSRAYDWRDRLRRFRRRSGR